MLSVEFDRHPGCKNLPDLNEVSNVLGMEYFISAMDSRWRMVNYLMFAKPYAVSLQRLQNQEIYDFGNNYLDFAQGLLKFQPELRYTAEAALETKLMKAVMRRRGEKGDVVCV